jgi:radical SAM-linked protein
MSLSPALGLGIASRAEYVDFDANDRLEAQDVLARVNATLPDGLRLTAMVPLDLRAPALQDAIHVATYRAEVPGAGRNALEEAVATFHSADRIEIVRTRKGRERRIDLRPLVASLAVDGGGALVFSLVLSREGSARPGEILEFLAGEQAAATAEVTRLEMFAGRPEHPVSPLLAGHEARRREP